MAMMDYLPERRAERADPELERAGLSKFLSRLLLRSELSEEEREAILTLKGTSVRTDAHRDIVRLGQLSDYACLVIDGLAGRFDQLANGKRQITALHIVGDMCDLHSVPVPHTGWGIEALSDTVTLRIPHAALLELINRYPRVALAFWRDTIVDSSILAKWISALGRRAAQARLAHLLCEMGLRSEQAGLGTRSHFQLPTTQGQLADVLGLSAVHFNRTIQSLRQSELVFADRWDIEVLDLPRLQRLAEFDPRYLLLEPSVE